MTARKHFKQLVRTRAKKTGESYSSARRHIISKGKQAAAPESARHHLPGSVPATTALRVLLTQAGLTDPTSEQALSEAMVFGLAGGIGIGVFQFHYEQEDMSSFFLGARHLWHDDLAYTKTALRELGLESRIFETAGARSSRQHLEKCASNGSPCILWVDAGNLPHRGMPASFDGGGYHVITLYSIDETAEVACIGDCADTPIKLKLDELSKARSRIKKFKNRILQLDDRDRVNKLTKPQLAKLVQSGLMRCHSELSNPSMKGSRRNFQLDALKSWAERLQGSSSKDSWQRVFRPGANLWRGLTWIYDSIELYGTGGGLCRPIMAEFLSEASESLAQPELLALSRKYAELGQKWSALAYAALPEHVSKTNKARQLLDKRSELLHTQAPVEQVRDTWQALETLTNGTAKQFPLDKKAIEALFGELSERVLELHGLETQALQDMHALIS